MMENGKPRKRWQLSPQEKWEIFLEVTSQQLTQADAARKWGVDVSTVIRIGALASLWSGHQNRSASRTRWSQRCGAQFRAELSIRGRIGERLGEGGMTESISELLGPRELAVGSACARAR